MRRPPQSLTLALLFTIAIFLLFPGLDLWVSGLFYRPGQGFWMGGYRWLQELRNAYWILGDSLALAGLALMVLWLLMGRGRAIPARLWGFVFATMALGPGALVNFVVKPLWGRARPADTTLFGGHHLFTPFFEPTNQCHWGCSFVSGEGAANAVTVVVIGVFLWPLLRRRGRIVAAIALAAFAAFGSMLRVMAGRHFLSDIVFGSFLSLYVCWWLYHVMNIAEARASLTRATLRADLRRLLLRGGSQDR